MVDFKKEMWFDHIVALLNHQKILRKGGGKGEVLYFLSSNKNIEIKLFEIFWLFYICLKLYFRFHIALYLTTEYRVIFAPCNFRPSSLGNSFAPS